MCKKYMLHTSFLILCISTPAISSSESAINDVIPRLLHSPVEEDLEAPKESQAAPPQDIVINEMLYRVVIYKPKVPITERLSSDKDVEDHINTDLDEFFKLESYKADHEKAATAEEKHKLFLSYAGITEESSTESSLDSSSSE